MEIRNITPMNTTPAFGMAFKAPDEKDMERLVDYLLDYGMTAKEARKALVKMQKAHAGDTHFDFKYIHENGVDTFAVAPKTKKAEEMLENKAVTFEEVVKLISATLLYDRYHNEERKNVSFIGIFEIRNRDRRDRAGSGRIASQNVSRNNRQRNICGKSAQSGNYETSCCMEKYCKFGKDRRCVSRPDTGGSGLGD